MMCEFNYCHYPLNRKGRCVKRNNKKIFYMPHKLPIVSPHHILKQKKKPHLKGSRDVMSIMGLWVE